MFVYLLQLTRRVIVLVKGGLDSSKAYYSPVVLRSKTKILSFWDPFRKKMCVVSKMENIVKKYICAVRKCALYQMCVISNVR